MQHPIKWRRYQHDVARHLQSIGFEVIVGETITGARNSHEVDVSARCSKAGLSLLWVVECKLWSRPVHKEQVLTFCSIVDDIGADRGLFIADGGFQSGARAAASSRSISLLTLDELRALSVTELYAIRLEGVERKAESVIKRIYAVVRRTEGRNIRSVSWMEPHDAKIGRTEAVGLLSFIQEAVKDARLYGLPVSLPDTFDADHRFIESNDWIEFLQVVEKLLNEAEVCVSNLEAVNKIVE